MTTSYYNWLVSKVGGERNYSKLLRFLFKEDFTWSSDVPMDNSREEDGYELRFIYFDENRKRIDVLQDKNCSVLEMLIALAVRVDRDIVGVPGEAHPEKLFWDMLNNAGLLIFDDSRFDENAVYSIIDNILRRNYSPAGYGGFFPLNRAYQDQRMVPLWDQMNQYIIESYLNRG